MIFPKECKVVGNASTQPLGDKVYCLTQYLIRPSGDSFEVLKVTPKEGDTMMREIESVEVIAEAKDVAVWNGEIFTPHDRAGLIQKALSTGKRCTIFGEKHNHMTFVLDPDLSEFCKVHVYDITPPRPTLSATLKELERIGFFETDNICFEHHIKDIAKIEGDVYPCKAGGFEKTLDRDIPEHGNHIVCCQTGRQITHENYGDDFTFEETCPLSMVQEEPFIARCCRIERTGIRKINGKFGIVVHWAAPAKVIANSVESLMYEWRKRNG